jgi:dienelactone hydrolase
MAQENDISEIPQYSLSKILLVWAAAAIPLGILGWLVAPALARDTEKPGLERLAVLTVGLVWQFLLVMILLYRETGHLRWSAVRQRLWLNTPRSLDTNHLQAKAEIADATVFLNERVGQADRGLAVIGFSLGAYYALDLAAADPEHIRSVVIFYGTGDGDYSNSRAAYLGHFAENDEFEPQSNVDNLEESLRRAGRPVTFYRYSGTGHWFFEPDRSQAYNQAAASLAWDRTLAFLRRSSTS